MTKLIDKPKKVNVPKAKVVALISEELGTEMTMKSAKIILEKLGLGKDLEWRENSNGNLTAWR
tara:strand:+ start:291 stop:479 length:189 start_codon:yes stop_codon:yes gene_type:complete